MIITMHIGIGYPYKLLNGNLIPLLFIFIMFIFEWLQREQLFALSFKNDKIPQVFRWIIYIFITLSIIWYHGKEAEFIYFQF